MGVKLAFMLSLLPSIALANIRITVTPAATGRQLIRFSLPLKPGQFGEGMMLEARSGRWVSRPGVRALDWYAPAAGVRSARAALVTFPYKFQNLKPVRFRLKSIVQRPEKRLRVEVDWKDDTLQIRWPDDPARTIDAKVVAPPRESTARPVREVVELNPYYSWTRFRLSDPKWPREVEVRADALGRVALVAHLQRMAGDGVRAPDFGWEVKVTPGIDGSEEPPAGSPRRSTFGGWLPNSPRQSLRRTGESRETGSRASATLTSYAYRAADNVPMQMASWRRAELVLSPPDAAPLTPALTESHQVRVDSAPHSRFPAEFEPVLKYHRDAIVRSMAVGADMGNVTGYSDGSDHGGSFGMNRLNHCAPMFAEGHRSGDNRLIETALLWCDNFIDQSIWWGPGETGGTRYNNLAAMGQKPPDTAYMWRSDSAVSFCTKGFEAFALAWRETGDPRYREAMEAQVDYCRKHMHAGLNYTRNIGVVRDFLTLYRLFDDPLYLQDALKLFRDLRPLLSTGDLFTESGKPIDPSPPFIEDDAAGYQHPFAKPYILGYALEGLPELARLAPDEPKLRHVAKAVADFMAASQDPVGGWRYPHPRSSSVIMSQAMEHAWQLVQADRFLGPQAKHLDAIERVLRQRILGRKATGKMFSGLGGWELATGKVKTAAEIPALYPGPSDRDSSRDYSEGTPSIGGGPPEGIIYFPEVLSYYLAHRPASRLFAEPAAAEPIGAVLQQVKAR